MKNSSLQNYFRNQSAKASWLLSRFRDEVKGVAAIEFAFLAPLMILLYVGTIEVSAAVSANRKLSRASSTMGDLITQVGCLSDNNITDMIEIIDDIMYPFNNSVKVTIAGVRVTGSNVAVEWSRAYNGATKPPVGGPYTVPNKIKTDGNFLVAVKMDISYSPAVGWFSVKNATRLQKDNSALEMSEEIFLRPRVGDDVRIDNNC